MIPRNGWKEMGTAPRDGSIILVRYSEWNDKSRRQLVQPAQWLPDVDGTKWTWRAPWRPGTITHADAWMTFAEFQAAQVAAEILEEKRATPEFDL